MAAGHWRHDCHSLRTTAGTKRVWLTRVNGAPTTKGGGCARQQDRDRDDPLAELIANSILTIAAAGERDPKK
jgi:hypothetical protein